jgi:hypothetical protein
MNGEDEAAMTHMQIAHSSELRHDQKVYNSLHVRALLHIIGSLHSRLHSLIWRTIHRLL